MGSLESHEAGFPPFPHSLESLRDSHIHGLDDWMYVFSCPSTRTIRHRKGLVTDISGPQRNVCPGTLTIQLDYILTAAADVEDIGELSILLLERDDLVPMNRFPGAFGSSQIDSEIFRRKYRLDSVTLPYPKTCLRLKVIAATKRRVAMKALIDSGNQPALALKAGLRRDVAADLKQVALQYLTLITPSQVAEVKLPPSVAQSLPSSTHDLWKPFLRSKRCFSACWRDWAAEARSEASGWPRLAEVSRKPIRFVCSCSEMRSTCNR